MQPQPILTVDPFDLPDWLGTDQVTWSADFGLRTGHHVRGELTSPGTDRALVCDLLAVDRAYPAPVTCDTSRAAAHQAWQHGQVLLGEYGDRLVLAVPGTVFGADLVLDAVSRLAKAVGAAPERYAAHLRIGERGPRRAGSEG
ncbi:hypothetical protein [uncultured Nocardioides sp.]|uniref:hypothetical protein n=1 Tax=uncultured Nocardioides sp. TaxID=198441 RepID=UPI0025E4BD29|nr:hypothetical protein [uncultured Nocardioides sp.]